MAPHKAVTLTHVRYQKGDLLGHFLAWISLVPVFISFGGFGGFVAVYFTLLTYKGIGLGDTRNKVALCFLPWCLALLTMYSKVYLGYHTLGQVFAGSGFGVVLGGLWFWVLNSVLICLFPAIEEGAFGIRLKNHSPKFERNRNLQ